MGGPDVDARLDLMKAIGNEFDCSAVGSNPDLENRIVEAGFRYNTYSLARRVDPIRDLKTLFQLYHLFNCSTPEIVHTFDTKPCIWGRLSARLSGVPIIVGTIPGLGSLYTRSGLVNRVVRTFYELLQKVACHLSDLTIFQNPEDAQEFVTRGIVSPAKAMVIPGSGVCTDQFDPRNFSPVEHERIRADLGIPTETLLVTMISRLIRPKGVLEFAKAGERVRVKYPQVKFLLVGPVDDESIDRLTTAEITELRQTVIWAGVRRDIPVILAASDIFVLPSFYCEGIPRVLLEAASMGLPIVTTNSPGCNQVVIDGLNGILIPNRDPEVLALAILRLIESPDLRQHFGQESRRRAVEHFDLSKIAEQMRLTYLGLLERKGLLLAGNV